MEGDKSHMVSSLFTGSRNVMNYSLYHLCFRTERDKSRPYGSRPASYKHENYAFNSYP